MDDIERILRFFDGHNPNQTNQSKLAHAVRTKNITKVEHFLEQGVSPNVRFDNRGYTALHEACSSDDMVEIVRVLTSSGADIELKTVQGETPLFVACSNSCEKIVEFFLSRRCLVNSANINNVTPLHMACRRRNDNIIEMLIRAGANLDAKDNNTQTPVFYAIQSKNPTAVKILLEVGSDSVTTDSLNRSPLEFSVEVGNLEIFDILIKHLVLSEELINQQNSNGWTLLMTAVRFKNFDIAEKLISYGADTSLVDSRGMLALHVAAHRNRTDIFELVMRCTPKDVIERYAGTRVELDYLMNLPCLLITENMFDGLKFLFEYGVSDEVLSCPSRFGNNNLVSPVSFLLLHANNIDQHEKVRYLELLLSKEALKDPAYDDHNMSVTRSVDAAIRSHKIGHENCNCLLLLTMLLDKGVDPDVPLVSSIPQPFINAMKSCFVGGLCSLLAHSNLVEPEHLLVYFLNSLSSPNYTWNSKERELMKFLVWASTDFKSVYPHITEVMTSSPANVHPEILPFFEIITTKALKVQSLKHLSRLSVRKSVHSETLDNPKMFRNKIKKLRLPRTVEDFLLYQESLDYIN